MNDVQRGESKAHGARGSILIRVDIPDSDALREYGITQEAEAVIYECSGINFTYGWRVVEVAGPEEPTVCYRCGCAYHGFVDPCEECTHRLCATVNPDGPTLSWAPTMKPTLTERTDATEASPHIGSTDGEADRG